jgi:hypothetical protein
MEDRAYMQIYRDGEHLRVLPGVSEILSPKCREIQDFGQMTIFRQRNAQISHKAQPFCKCMMISIWKYSHNHSIMTIS